jgi:ribosomal protein L21E
MTSPSRLTDRNGVVFIRPHSHVKITHPRHSYSGRTGTIVRIEGHRVWVALPDGTVVGAGHRSVEVL